MSTKRTASTELNADNWNDEDEREEKGTFQSAPSDELKNRVFRKATRKLTSSEEKPSETTKSIFSSFAGFGKGTSSPFSSLLNKSSASLSKNTEIGKSNNGDLDKSSDYCNKLKFLNENLLDWVKTHVVANPICILSPIFADYEKHLKFIEDNSSKNDKKTESTYSETKEKSTDSFKQFKFTVNQGPKMNFSNPMLPSQSSVKADLIPEKVTVTSEASSTKNLFSFGTKPENSTSTSTKNAGFSFGTASGSTFSFTNDKPFTFESYAKPSGLNENKPSGNENNEENEDYKPPTASFTPVVEEDSIYSKKCKVFVKSEENFADRGVGTLFLKPIKDQKRTQLLVRADTNLGNVLLNIILNDTIPTRRMGKNNVMIACCLTPESNKPTQILIRVKTGEEADELLEIIDKHKVTVD